MAYRVDIFRRIYQRILEFKPNRSEKLNIRIVDAIIDCIAEKGILQLNHSEVARRAGLKTSRVLLLFPTKDDMTVAAIKLCFAQGQDIFLQVLARAEDSAEKRIEAYVWGTFQWLRNNPRHRAVMREMRHFATANASYDAILGRIVGSAEDRIEAILLSAGTGNPADAKPLARTIRAMIATGVDGISSEADVTSDSERQAVLKIVSLARSYWNVA